MFPAKAPRRSIARRALAAFATALCLFASAARSAEAPEIPHLAKVRGATQLFVDGKPFLVLGGELHNSSSSSLDYMKPLWPKLAEMNLNTVLAPVSWELVEPEEGRFDFSIVDGLIEGARSQNLRLILLWFGSWKNSMSCYAPAWVKANPDRFPRAVASDGSPQEILSPFSAENLRADARAFAALMAHLRRFDGSARTVIMVQVENEIGMLPDARDHSPAADEAYRQPVPQPLLNLLTRQEPTLAPELREAWVRAGRRGSGNWEQLFGASLATEELFMAWSFARYTDAVAAAGSAEYPLPLYANTALNRPGALPGQYPSAGPLPHLLDVWRAAAPHIDFFSPDIYFPDFARWCERYRHGGNPLFIPEMRALTANLFFALGSFDAMGVSPFGIEDECAAPHADGTPTVRQSYAVLRQLSPLLLQHQGRGDMAGVWLDDTHRTETVTLGDYTFTIAHDYTWAYSPGYGKPAPWPRLGGLIIMTGPGEYELAGSGLVVTFRSNVPGRPRAGILSIDEGRFEGGRWVAGRRLNGDEDHQGRHLRLPPGEAGIQLLKLYAY